VEVDAKYREVVTIWLGRSQRHSATRRAPPQKRAAIGGQGRMQHSDLFIETGAAKGRAGTAFSPNGRAEKDGSLSIACADSAQGGGGDGRVGRILRAAGWSKSTTTDFDGRRPIVIASFQLPLAGCPGRGASDLPWCRSRPQYRSDLVGILGAGFPGMAPQGLCIRRRPTIACPCRQTHLYVARADIRRPG
jgi:hypothetical protein